MRPSLSLPPPAHKGGMAPPCSRRPSHAAAGELARPCRDAPPSWMRRRRRPRSRRCPYVTQAPTLAAGNLFNLAAICQVVPHGVFVFDGQELLQVSRLNRAAAPWTQARRRMDSHIHSPGVVAITGVACCETSRSTWLRVMVAQELSVQELLLGQHAQGTAPPTITSAQVCPHPPGFCLHDPRDACARTDVLRGPA